ncbi:MAG: DNA helicase RecG, partial [Clostridiales bacterium]|nr:DNA helicase RecG [Clostridiales bacterium]
MQHYRAAIRFLEPLGARAALLTGSLSKSEREDALFAVRTQGADIVIGTHALIGEDVRFCNVSFVITDEQQRFGVNQRGALENKAAGADILVMTATPIPRTLALCLYGELEQSSIAALPAGRPEIITKLVPPEKFDGMYAYIMERANEGEQAYIVCPRIESEEDEDLVSAVQLHGKLRAKFTDSRIGILHGRMREQEKADVMGRFLRGEIRVLVSTTVIEVGIDVPQATNIVICNAERYGLSQLHQLRGRVGRGARKSYCFLPVGNAVPERLHYFCGCRDGFALSEYDFSLRGAGDFIGTRQHGDGGDLPVKVDAELIYTAKAVAEDALRDRETAQRLLDGLAEGAEQYVRSITMN